ncbi:MAG: histidinol-phosphate transaminase [Clostridia bacterium]|nr:histidinol-phosphate transaminase [Clostridia bacterium]
MSKFFSAKYAKLVPYVPGEQPKDAQYVKLNTNESPFPPPSSVVEAVKTEGGRLQLYSDPESALLTQKTAEILGVKASQVLMTNGSDEALNFAFMAFCDETHPIVFPDISYGFYSVFAKLNGIPYKTVALKEDFSVDYRDYLGVKANVVIANPNAPTGLALSRAEVEEILKSNPENVVIIDEAYVDFGGESCVSLIDQYENLLVTQTFSKSRSLAGARLGMAIGNEKLIADLNTIKYSTNPYNVNRMTAAAGFAALCETEWFETCVRTIQENRESTKTRLQELGFTVLDSKTNFLFAKSEKVSGEELYKELKSRGVLVRHFSGERIKDYVRITVGTAEQMQILLEKTAEILKEKKV